MCFIFSLVPATIFVTIGYFVLFSSVKIEGTMKTFARILAVWIFIVATFFPICGAYMTLSGKCPIVKVMSKIERVINR